MTDQEQHDLKYDFSFQTGLKVTVELMYGDVVILPALQAFNAQTLKAITYWIEDRFQDENLFASNLPKVMMIPQGQTRYEMGVRLSQTQAVKMLKKRQQAHL